MNHPRVNLLKKSEQRYQGTVSRRFVLVSMVVTPILFITLLSGVKLIQYTAVKSSLRSSSEVWATLKPRLALYTEERRSLSLNRQAMELLEGWRGTQVSFSKLLTEIQGSVPANIQLTRLAVRGEPGTSIYEKPEDFTLGYTLAIQGVAQGDRAEEVVIGLRKTLLTTEHMGATFESIKLVSMRKRSGTNGQSAREFSLNGSSVEGDEQ